MEIPVRFTAEQREGDYYDYVIKLAPYSMQSRSPSERLDTLKQLLMGIILPSAPQLAEQGIEVDWLGLVKTIARLSDMPELDDVLTVPGNVLPQQLGSAHSQKMSPNTTRTNVRVNRPGATESGKEEALVQTLMGGGVNDDQMKSVSRPTG